MPSRKYGLSACDAYTIPRSRWKSTAACAVSSRVPSTAWTAAPYTAICFSFAAGALAGAKTCARTPVRAEKAATDAPALPEESSTSSVTPDSTATASITDEPRSLNDPVRLSNSSLAERRATPSSAPSAGRAISGVSRGGSSHRDSARRRGRGGSPPAVAPPE